MGDAMRIDPVQNNNVIRPIESVSSVENGQVESAKSDKKAPQPGEQHGRQGAQATWEETKAVAERINRMLEAIDHQLQFYIHKATGKMAVKVIDRETGKVIREIPPESLLDLDARIHEMVGLFLDEMS